MLTLQILPLVRLNYMTKKRTTNNLKLKFNLSLIAEGEENAEIPVVSVGNEIILNSILEPAMLSGANKQIEDIFKLLGTDYFLKQVRAYLLQQQEEVYAQQIRQRQEANDIKVLELPAADSNSEDLDPEQEGVIEEVLGEKTLDVE